MLKSKTLIRSRVASLAQKRGRDQRLGFIGPARKRIKLEVAKQIQQSGELKSMDTSGTVQMNSTPVLTLLNGLVQGVETYQRVGKKIKADSMHIRWNLFPTGNVNSGTDEVQRMVLFWDNSPNGVAPTMAQLLKSTDNGGTVTTTAYSGANMDYSDRFTILRDWFWSIPLSAVFADSTGSIDRESASGVYFTKLNKETKFLLTSGGISGIGTGALYLLTTSSHASSFNAFAVNVHCRLRYTDI